MAKYVVAWNHSGNLKHRVMPLKPLLHHSRAEAEKRARAASREHPQDWFFVFDEDVELVATFHQGKRILASLKGRSKRSRRDVSRADLKYLSTGALLKLLRQATNKGDEDLVEAIGKELDRRGGGYKRRGRR